MFCFRSLILDDRSLKIQKTQVSDEGVYVCRIENSLGWQEAQAMLTVHCRFSLKIFRFQIFYSKNASREIGLRLLIIW